jgi:hypothetical protein
LSDHRGWFWGRFIEGFVWYSRLWRHCSILSLHTRLRRLKLRDAQEFLFPQNVVLSLGPLLIFDRAGYCAPQ